MTIAVDVKQGAAHTFQLRPESVVTAPTAKVLSPSGKLLESPAAVVDSVSTTVATDAGNTRDVVKVASAAGITPGRVYAISDADWGQAFAEVASVNGNIVTLVEPLPGVPPNGSAFEGTEVQVSITSASSVDRGRGFRVIMTAGTLERVQVFHVVRQPFTDPVTARHVADYLNDWFPRDDILKSGEKRRNVAEEANSKLRSRLLESARYPDLYWDHDAFDEAAKYCMMLVLAERGRVPGSQDLQDYRRQLWFDIQSRVGAVLKGVAPFDANDDGQLDDAESAQTVKIGRMFR